MGVVADAYNNDTFCHNMCIPHLLRHKDVASF